MQEHTQINYEVLLSEQLKEFYMVQPEQATVDHQYYFLEERKAREEEEEEKPWQLVGPKEAEAEIYPKKDSNKRGTLRMHLPRGILKGGEDSSSETLSNEGFAFKKVSFA